MSFAFIDSMQRVRLMSAVFGSIDTCGVGSLAPGACLSAPCMCT